MELQKHTDEYRMIQKRGAILILRRQAKPERVTNGSTACDRDFTALEFFL
jgi:hypothetical protein